MNSDLDIQEPVLSRAATITPASTISGFNFDPSLSSRANSPQSIAESYNTISVDENLLYRTRNRTSWVWKPENGLPYRTVDTNGIIRERWRCATCMY